MVAPEAALCNGKAEAQGGFDSELGKEWRAVAAEKQTKSRAVSKFGTGFRYGKRRPIGKGRADADAPKPHVSLGL